MWLPLPDTDTGLNVAGQALRGRCATSTSRRAGETLALVGATARASRCSSRCCPGSTTSPKARSGSTAPTSASCRSGVAHRGRHRLRDRHCSRCRWPRPAAGSAGASDEDLAQAVEIAAAQFVYDLPYGLQTRIGEQGMSLSGGPAARLSLAARSFPHRASWSRRHPVRARRPHRGGGHRGVAAVLAGVTGWWWPTARRRCCWPTRWPCSTAGPSPHRDPHRVAGDRSPLPLPAGRRRRLDDGCEPRPDWEDDDDRERLDHAYEEAARNAKPPPPCRLRGLRGAGDDRHRMARQARRAARGPAGRRGDAASPQARALLGRCCGRFQVHRRVARSGRHRGNAARLSVPLLVHAASTTRYRRWRLARRVSWSSWSRHCACGWCCRPSAGLFFLNRSGASGRRCC